MDHEYHDVSSMVSASLKTCVGKFGKLWLMMPTKDHTGSNIWVSYHKGHWWFQDGQDWVIYVPPRQVPPAPPPVGYHPVKRSREYY